MGLRFAFGCVCYKVCCVVFLCDSTVVSVVVLREIQELCLMGSSDAHIGESAHEEKCVGSSTERKRAPGPTQEFIPISL